MRLLALLVFLFFANAFDMPCVAMLCDNFARRLVVISFIQAKILRLLLVWLRTFNNDSL